MKKFILVVGTVVCIMLAMKSYKALQEWHVVEAQAYAKRHGALPEVECRKGPTELKQILRCKAYHLPPDHAFYVGPTR